MAILTCIRPVFYLQGDGASTTFVISLKTTPLVFSGFTVINFPKNVNNAIVTAARDSQNNDVLSEISVTTSGSAVTLTFTTPFSDLWIVNLQFQFVGG